MKLPKTKTENIVVQNLKDEVLIYDLTTNQAFCLNDTAAKVFNACDGATTFDELKTKYQLTEEIIYLALDGLQKQNLLADGYASPLAGMSRREVIRKVGLASMIALPVISGLIAPPALQAASCIAGGQESSSFVDTAVESFDNCYPKAAAKCCSGMFGTAGGSSDGAGIFVCTVTCS